MVANSSPPRGVSGAASNQKSVREPQVKHKNEVPKVTKKDARGPPSAPTS